MAPTNEEKHDEAYRAAEAAVREADPGTLAGRAGVRWLPSAQLSQGGPAGVLEIAGFGGVARANWPDLAFHSEHPLLQIFPWRLIALHYLAGATAREPGEDWISYRELPDGLFYANTVTREVEKPMAERYAAAREDFLAAGRALGGAAAQVADAALIFRPLPRVAMLAALWLADEEFPAKVKILYDRAGAENLPLQDLRILADLLWSGLKRFDAAELPSPSARPS